MTRPRSPTRPAICCRWSRCRRAGCGESRTAAPPSCWPERGSTPRFLPEYDNLLLSYAERSRVIPHRRPVPLPPGHGATGGTLLVDGRWQADWKIVKGGLEIEPFVPLSASDRDAVAAEGERLLGFATPAIAVRDVRFAPVRSG
jgi:hypothetical protein